MYLQVISLDGCTSLESKQDGDLVLVHSVARAPRAQSLPVKGPAWSDIGSMVLDYDLVWSNFLCLCSNKNIRELFCAVVMDESDRTLLFAPYYYF